MSKAKKITQSELDDFDAQAQSDGQQMKATSEEFMDAAPPMKFNLPFGLGKLFNLPGEKDDEQRRQAHSSKGEAA